MSEQERACCTGINGSHTWACLENTAPTLVCWQCGAIVPAGYAMSWSDKGSRCLRHRDLVKKQSGG